MSENASAAIVQRLARIAQQRHDEEEMGVPHSERTPWFPPKRGQNDS